MITLFRKSLSFQILFASFLGIFLGIFLGDLCTLFAPWENAYIMILKITTIPYLVCAVIHGIGNLSTSSAKSILQKGILFISGMWAVNICTIYMIAYLFPRSSGSSYTSYSSVQPASINFAEMLIPDNIFAALSNNLVPAIVVFGILTGISLMHVKEKHSMMGMLDTLVNSLTKITGWISRITPIGTFMIMADRVGSMQLVTFKQIATYLVLYATGISLLVFWIIPRIVAMFTVISPGDWLKSLSPLMLLAFTTNLVIVTLPFLIDIIKKHIEYSYCKEDRLGDEVQGITTVIFNLPLGSPFIAIFIFFVSVFYNIPLMGEAQVQLFLTSFLTSLGAIGVGSWINSLNFLLDTLGLPLGAIDTYMATLPFTGGFQSLISVMEVSSLSLLITLGCNGLLKLNWQKILKHGVMIAIPIVLFILTFKEWIKLPPITNTAQSIAEVSIEPKVPVRIYSIDESPPEARSGDVFDRVIFSKVLRVGYNPQAIPFCFFNHKKEIIGYDISLAYALAKDLGCSLELVPMNLSLMAEELQKGIYDIAMSSVTINETRLKVMKFTNPYLESRVAFVMKKKYRKKFRSVSDILKDPSVKVVVRKATSYEQLAQSIFPPSKVVVIDDYDIYTKQYSNDILLRGEFQLISWSLFHPKYSVIIPDPLITKEVFGYAIAEDADKWLFYLNLWLQLKKVEGLSKQEFDFWVLGKTQNAKATTRRWSIIRDVLGWTEN